VGAEGMKVNLATDHHPETNIKRSQIAIAVISIALDLGFFEIVRPSRTVSNT